MPSGISSLRCSRTVMATLGLSLVPMVVVGGSTTSIVTSTATVLPTCRALTVQPMSFGSYNFAAVDTVASATFTVQCSASASISVALDRGVSAGSSITSRRMSDGRGNTLSYQLYTAADRLNIWGDGSAGSTTITALGRGLDSTLLFTVYGVIPAGQSTAVPGQYSDTITITLTY